MAVVRWTFENGTNGTALSSSNAGSTSVLATGGTAVISTAQAYEGTRSTLMTGTTTSGVLYLQKDITSTSSVGFDTFIYITEAPSTEATVIWGGNATTRQISVSILTDRRVRLRDAGGSGGTTLWTSTSSLALNAWYRVSVFVTQNASTGTVRAAYFTGSSTTPTEDSTLLTNQNTGASPYTSLRIGVKSSTGTSTFIAHFDNYGYDTAATGLIPIASPPDAVVNSISPAAIIDAATSSTGSGLTYSISQVSGPTKTATLITAGKWSIPLDADDDTVWTVTVTQGDGQTDTQNVTVVSNANHQPLVEMLYATGPGTFV